MPAKIRKKIGRKRTDTLKAAGLKFDSSGEKVWAKRACLTDRGSITIRNRIEPLLKITCLAALETMSSNFTYVFASSFIKS